MFIVMIALYFLITFVGDVITLFRRWQTRERQLIIFILIDLFFFLVSLPLLFLNMTDTWFDAVIVIPSVVYILYRTKLIAEKRKKEADETDEMKE